MDHSLVPAHGRAPLLDFRSLAAVDQIIRDLRMTVQEQIFNPAVSLLNSGSFVRCNEVMLAGGRFSSQLTVDSFQMLIPLVIVSTSIKAIDVRRRRSVPVSCNGHLPHLVF